MTRLIFRHLTAEIEILLPDNPSLDLLLLTDVLVDAAKGAGATVSKTTTQEVQL